MLTAVLAAELVIKSVVELAAEPVMELAAVLTTESVALLSNYFGMQLFLFLLSFDASFNSYAAFFFTAFPFYSLFFYFKLSPLAFLILSLFSPTINAPLLARFPAGLYRVALYMGPVTAAASYSILSGFHCLVCRP